LGDGLLFAFYSFSRRRDEEYIVALNYFEDDHDLIISAWETVLDASAYLSLIDTFNIEHRHWRVFQLGEMSLYCILVVGVQHRDSPTAQLSAIIVLQILSGLYTWWRNPFLCNREATLEYVIKGQLCVNAILGLISHSGAYPARVMGGLLIASNLVFLGVVTYLLELLQAIANFFVQSLRRSFDGYIVDFVYSMVGDRSYIFEQPNKGLILLQQWDDALKEEQWHFLMKSGRINPASLLSTYERLVYQKWSAFRNLKLEKLKSWTGMLYTCSPMGDYVSQLLT